MQNFKSKILNAVLIFVFVLGWVFSGWPQLPGTNFPAEIPKALATGGVIMLWDGADIPQGWTCVSCETSDWFYGKFLMANSAPGVGGGADSGTHTFNFDSDTPSDSGSDESNGGGGGASYAGHTHTWHISSQSSDDIRPPFKNLKLIKASNPATLPGGIIGIFNTVSLPYGWSYYSALDAKYVRGDANTNTGGAATHFHTISAYGDPTGDDGGVGGSDFGASDGSDSPTASGNTLNNSNDPSFVTVKFAQLGATSAPPSGLIAIFDDSSLPSNWTSISGASPYVGRLLKGSSSPGSTGGASTHNNNASVTISSSGEYDVGLALRYIYSSIFSDPNHTHDVTYTISSESSFPSYRDVILGQFSDPLQLYMRFRLRGVRLRGSVKLHYENDKTRPDRRVFAVTVWPWLKKYYESDIKTLSARSVSIS